MDGSTQCVLVPRDVYSLGVMEKMVSSDMEILTIIYYQKKLNTLKETSSKFHS